MESQAWSRLAAGQTDAPCTTIANVFLLKGKALITPARDQGILTGVTRQTLLHSAAATGSIWGIGMSQVWRTSFVGGGIFMVETNSQCSISENPFNFKDFKKIFGKT